MGRVDSMRILYDKLLLSKGYEDISVKNYVESLTDCIIALFPERAKVTVDKQIADFQLDPKRLFPLGLIINELLTNQMKYAFIDRDSGRIQISLTHIDNRVTAGPPGRRCRSPGWVRHGDSEGVRADAGENAQPAAGREFYHRKPRGHTVQN